VLLLVGTLFGELPDHFFSQPRSLRKHLVEPIEYLFKVFRGDRSPLVGHCAVKTTGSGAVRKARQRHIQNCDFPDEIGQASTRNWKASSKTLVAVSESGNLQRHRRTEVPNTFNHPNFSQPDTPLGTVIGATGQTRDSGKLD
jgi:hypothetical protein